MNFPCLGRVIRCRSWTSCRWAEIIAVNLDHYRLNADYKHGLHFTALPTAWLSGFDTEKTFKIGSGTAWVRVLRGDESFRGPGFFKIRDRRDADPAEWLPGLNAGLAGATSAVQRQP